MVPPQTTPWRRCNEKAWGSFFKGGGDSPHASILDQLLHSEAIKRAMIWASRHWLKTAPGSLKPNQPKCSILPLCQSSPSLSLPLALSPHSWMLSHLHLYLQELGDLKMTKLLSQQGLLRAIFFTDDIWFFHVVFEEGNAAKLALSSRQELGLDANPWFFGYKQLLRSLFFHQTNNPDFCEHFWAAQTK